MEHTRVVEEPLLVQKKAGYFSGFAICPCSDPKPFSALAESAQPTSPTQPALVPAMDNLIYNLLTIPDLCVDSYRSVFLYLSHFSFGGFFLSGDLFKKHSRYGISTYFRIGMNEELFYRVL